MGASGTGLRYTAIRRRLIKSTVCALEALLLHIKWRVFMLNIRSPQHTTGNPSSRVRRNDAVMLVNEDGMIERVSEGTCRLLESDARSLTGQTLLRRVHPRAVHRVRHDLAQMVGREKQHADWLLRLKTGLGPWQWFKVEAKNRLNRTETGGIVLKLYERGCGHAGE